MNFTCDRCNVCYDHSSELADVSAGDLFKPAIQRGAEGWTAVIVRSDIGKRLVEGAQAGNYIRTEPIGIDNFFISAGFENKKHAAVYRILERKRHGYATPDFHIPIVDYPTPWPRRVDMKNPHSTGIAPRG